MSARNRMVSLYFAAQGTSTVLWWFVMFLLHGARPIFFPHEIPYQSFILPDLLFFVCGSFACAFAVRTGGRRMQVYLWLTAGGIIYATLLTITACIRTNEAWPGALAMSCAATGTLLCAFSLRGSDRE